MVGCGNSGTRVHYLQPGPFYRGDIVSGHLILPMAVPAWNSMKMWYGHCVVILSPLTSDMVIWLVLGSAYFELAGSHSLMIIQITWNYDGIFLDGPVRSPLTILGSAAWLYEMHKSPRCNAWHYMHGAAGTFVNPGGTYWLCSLWCHKSCQWWSLVQVLPLSPCQNIKCIFLALVGNHLTQNPYQTISICTYYILCDVAVPVINIEAY